MTDRPILFSPPMVRALLAGNKTQTRRVAGVPIIEPDQYGVYAVHGRGGGVVGVPDDKVGITAADYLPIQPGDRLYVREAWRAPVELDKVKPRDMRPGGIVYYEASVVGIAVGGKFRQAMHQPRWASRITLHVTEVRVQRLQEISEEDARAEGVDEATCYASVLSAHFDMDKVINPPLSGPHWGLGYRRLWESINGEGTWTDNPWVAAYTFEVECCNIAGARQP